MLRFIGVVISITMLVNMSVGLPCTAQWQCDSVTTNYNYVGCIGGVCKCRSDVGFGGNATVSNKCRCDAPKSVMWSSSDPYCVSLAAAVSCDLEKARNEILEQETRDIYTSLLWPTPVAIIREIIAGTADTGIMSKIFSPNAKGRVDPVGEFESFDGIVEYFYGSVWTGATRVVNVNFKKLLVQGNQSAVRVDLTFESYDLSTNPPTFQYSYNLTQTSIFTFNSNNLVTGVESIIHNLGWVSEGLLDKSPESLQLICGSILFQAGCDASDDPDGYFTDFADCVNFMNSIDYGTWDKLRDNSAICRFYHSILAVISPQIHCSHSGKTGGGKCVDKPYTSYYLKDF